MADNFSFTNGKASVNHHIEFDVHV